MLLRSLAILALMTAATAALAQEPPQSEAPRKTRDGGARSEVPPFDDRADRAGPPRLPGRGPEGSPRNPPPGSPRDPNDRPYGDTNRGPGAGQPGFRPPVERGGGMPGAPRPFPMPPEALEKYDPEMYKLLTRDQELERQTAELAIQCRRAPQEERSALKKQLGELVLQHFDVRQERRRLQLKRLEDELKALRTAIEKRDETREDIIYRHLLELLGEEPSLGF
jgi:hypothetical protein